MLRLDPSAEKPDPGAKCQNRKKSVTSDKLGGTDLQTYGKEESSLSVNTPLQMAAWVSDGGGK